MQKMQEQFSACCTLLVGGASPRSFARGDRHRLLNGRPLLLCGISADMLGTTRYAGHIRIDGDERIHHGLLDCGPQPTTVAPGSGAGGRRRASPRRDAMSIHALQRLAIVIPVGPGDICWRGLLPQLQPLPSQAQLRLVACRPEDVPGDFSPAALGLPEDSQWIVATRGRARQQNAGAASTTREFLWFVHADSRLQRSGGDSAPTLLRLQLSLQAAPDALHFFDLRFLRDGPAFTVLNALGAHLRSRCLGMPFGDQGLCISRLNFERLGRFDESLDSAEDHALVWAARRAGIGLRAVGAPMFTSARRYAEHGWLSTTTRHLHLTWTQARAFSRVGVHTR